MLIEKEARQKKLHAYCIIPFIGNANARQNKFKVTEIRTAFVCGVCGLEEGTKNFLR